MICFQTIANWNNMDKPNNIIFLLYFLSNKTIFKKNFIFFKKEEISQAKPHKI